jgi:hypothetical protein
MYTTHAEKMYRLTHTLLHFGKDERFTFIKYNDNAEFVLLTVFFSLMLGLMMLGVFIRAVVRTKLEFIHFLSAKVKKNPY